MSYDTVGSSEAEFTSAEEKQSKAFDLSKLTPVGELDWKDFLSAISDKKKPGIANSIKLNAKGYIIGNTLYIVFANVTMMNIVMKNDPRPLLKECASAAFGKNLNVMVEKKDDFEAMVPELKARAESEQEDDDETASFNNSVDLLKKLSEKEGFEITGLPVATEFSEDDIPPEDYDAPNVPPEDF
jgi:hypothetical protein